jgi:uncharacterized protein (TIGR03067 family)
MTERDIFLALLDLPDEAAKAAYLERACGGNAALRVRVEALIRSHENAGSFLGKPAVAPPEPDHAATRAFDPHSETHGDPARTGGTAAPDDESLGFLAPPGRPDSLGRIGHYEVLQVLGRGGFGIVFRAFDEVLQRVVAVKVLAPQMAATSPARKRFLREAQSSAQVRHENVVQVYEVNEQPLPYLVMEFIPGETLQQRLDRTGPLDVPEVLRIGRQIAEGLAAAHANGLIHRDIKPANVLIEGGPQHRVRITDFGLARAADDASISQSGVVAGTPMYMAPDQAKGETFDHRADLFSLGSVLYAMLSGRPPFRATTTLAVLKRVAEDMPRPIREIIPEVPEWFCRIVEKLHAKDPADRFQSARDVADLLADCEAQLTAHKAVKDISGFPGRRAGRPRRRRWLEFVAGAVVVLAGLVVWAGPHAMRYLRNRGEVEIVPQPGLTSVIVLQNGATVHDWLDMRTPRVLSLPAGQYVLNMGLKPGYTYEASGWEVEKRGLFDGTKFMTSGSSLQLTVARGERVTVRAVTRAEPARPPWPSDKDLLRGSWVAVSGELRGQPMTPDELRRVSITFTGGRARVTMPGGEGEGTFKLDPAQTPKEIDVIRTGDNLGMLGIYTLEGDRLTICMGDPGEARPTGFQTAPGSSRMVVVLRRGFASAEAGWVQLFNGEDLSGWKTHPNQPGDWKVEGGALVGSGRKSHLFSEREYEDFHLRFEARLNAGGDSGVIVRAPFFVKPERGGFAELFPKLGGEGPWGYEAQITGPRTGIVLAGDEVFGNPVGLAPDAWFTGEVIATGNRIVVRINGTTTANFEDPKRTYAKGHVALQVWHPQTVVHFRKIELRELPSGGPPDPAVVQSLREAIRAKESTRNVTRARVDAGAAAPMELVAAEAELAEARIRLAQAERDNATVVKHLQNLVALREEERHLYSLRVKAGADAVDVLNQAEGRLADAKARLAQAGGSPRPPRATAPFDAARAKELQEAWARHLGVTAEFTNSVGMKMRVIPPGECLQGSTPEEIRRATEELGPAYAGVVESEGPRHHVVLTAPFALGATEVTRGQFRQFVRETGYKTEAERGEPIGHGLDDGEWVRKQKFNWDTDPGFSRKMTDDDPVVNVTWNDAVEFCRWLSLNEGRTYALPTEAQWEFACRAGTQTPWWTGDWPNADRHLQAATWYDPVDTAAGFRKVASLAANPFGLYDMHGNVEEWCSDWYAAYATELSERNPTGPPAPTSARVVRSSNFNVGPAGLRSAYRISDDPGMPSAVRGFRVAIVGELRSTPSAAATFDAAKAKEFQESWAKHLGVPVESPNTLGMKMRLIPPGKFPMTADSSVTISKPFLIGAHEVTVRQFRAFVDETGYKTDAEKAGKGEAQKIAGERQVGPEFTWRHKDVAQGDDYPVGQVTWNDAAAFCEWLSRKEKMTYRLPTEAEWEWACRAGSLTAYHFGDDPAGLGEYAWSAANSGDKSHPVGSRKPNAWGLFDTHGNVAEHCLDWFEELGRGRAVDPRGPASGTRRVIRGYSFIDPPLLLTANQRTHADPAFSMHHFGFRVVCEVRPE